MLSPRPHPSYMKVVLIPIIKQIIAETKVISMNVAGESPSKSDLENMLTIVIKIDIIDSKIPPVIIPPNEYLYSSGVILFFIAPHPNLLYVIFLILA